MRIKHYLGLLMAVLLIDFLSAQVIIFSPDGSKLYCGGNIISTQSGEIIETINTNVESIKLSEYEVLTKNITKSELLALTPDKQYLIFATYFEYNRGSTYNNSTKYSFWDIKKSEFDTSKEKVIFSHSFAHHIEGDMAAVYYKYGQLGFVKLSEPNVITDAPDEMAVYNDIVRILPGVIEQGLHTDFKYIWADDEAKKIVLYSSNHKKIRTYSGHKVINDVQFFNDGTKMISVGDMTILWEVSTGKKIKVFNNSNGEIVKVALSPDGTLFCTLDASGRISISELSTGNEFWYKIPYADEIKNVALEFSLNSQLVAYAVKDQLFLFDTKTGETMKEKQAKIIVENNLGMALPEIVLANGNKARIRAIASNFNATLIATLDVDGILIVRDAKSGLVVRQIAVEDAIGEGFSLKQCTVDFDPNNEWVSVTVYGFPYIYLLETGIPINLSQPEYEERGTDWKITSSPVGKKGFFVTTKEEYEGFRSVVWDIETSKAVRKLNGRFISTDKEKVTVLNNNIAEQWDLITGKIIKKLSVKNPTRLKSTNEGKKFIIPIDKNQISVFEFDTGIENNIQLPEKFSNQEFDISMDGRFASFYYSERKNVNAVNKFATEKGVAIIELNTGKLVTTSVFLLFDTDKLENQESDLLSNYGILNLERLPEKYQQASNDALFAGFGYNDKNFYTLTEDGLLKKWELGKLKSTIISDSVVGLAFDNRKNTSEIKFLAYATKNEAFLLDLHTDKIIRSWQTKNEIYDIALSYSGIYLAVGLKGKSDPRSGSLIVFKTTDGSEVSNRWAPYYMPDKNNLVFSPKANLLAYTSATFSTVDPNIRQLKGWTYTESTISLTLWDLDSDNFTDAKAEQGKGGAGVAFSADGVWLQSSTGTNFEIKYDGVYSHPYCYGENFLDKNFEAQNFNDWKVKTSEQILVSNKSISCQVSIYPQFAGVGYLYMTNDGYYAATPGQAAKIGYALGKKAYGFDQFDLQYNRPDLVLAKFGISSPEVIAAYKRAYEKRLRRLGIKPDEFQKEISMNVPVVKIKSELETNKVNNREFVVFVEAMDKLQPLNRINVWVNGVPVFGIKGMEVTSTAGVSISKQIPLTLSAGKNVIEVSAVNTKGVEGVRERLDILLDVPATKPDLYILTIGVSDYVQDYDLRYAAKDASDIASALGSQTNRYEAIYQLKFLDGMATRDNILKAKETLMKSKVDDEVILFVASHGLLDDNLDYYIATHDVDFENPTAKGLLYEDLEGLLDGIPARKKLMMIDACHSGEVDKEDALLTSNTNQNSANGVSARGFTVVKSKGQALGLANSFELMKEIFADVRRGTGTVVISAAAGKEYAFENDQWKNGAFTYSLLEGLKTMNADNDKNKEVSLSEIRDYVSKKVQELTNGKQNPTSRAENLEFDFRVW